jgi:hypothetical protein
MFNLGCLYRDGNGIVQSFKKAAELFTTAAEQGHVKAMLGLGLLYIKGKGTDQSNELARVWWTKATQCEGHENEGHEDAIKWLKKLDEQEGKSTTTAPTTKTSSSTTTAPTTKTSSSPFVCCSSCNKPQPTGQRFSKCTGCRTVQYCNKECQ